MVHNPRVNFNPNPIHGAPPDKVYSGAEICKLAASKNFADRDFGNHLARVYGKHSGRYVPGGVSQLLVDIYQAWNDNSANKYDTSPYEGVHWMPVDYQEAITSLKHSVYSLMDSMQAREDNPETWMDIIQRRPEVWK